MCHRFPWSLFPKWTLFFFHDLFILKAGGHWDSQDSGFDPNSPPGFLNSPTSQIFFSSLDMFKCRHKPTLSLSHSPLSCPFRLKNVLECVPINLDGLDLTLPYSRPILLKNRDMTSHPWVSSFSCYRGWVCARKYNCPLTKPIQEESFQVSLSLLFATLSGFLPFLHKLPWLLKLTWAKTGSGGLVVCETQEGGGGSLTTWLAFLTLFFSLCWQSLQLNCVLIFCSTGRIWAAASYLPKSPAVTHSCCTWPWNLGDIGIMAIKSIRATATIIIMMTASTY